jgi:hypothetical protein
VTKQYLTLAKIEGRKKNLREKSKQTSEYNSVRNVKIPKQIKTAGNTMKRAKYRNPPGSTKRKTQYFSFPRVKFVKFNCRFFAKCFRKMELVRLFQGWKRIELVFHISSLEVNRFKLNKQNKMLGKCFKVLKSPKYYQKKAEMENYTRPININNSKKIYLNNKNIKLNKSKYTKT